MPCMHLSDVMNRIRLTKAFPRSAVLSIQMKIRRVCRRELQLKTSNREKCTLQPFAEEIYNWRFIVQLTVNEDNAKCEISFSKNLHLTFSLSLFQHILYNVSFLRMHAEHTIFDNCGFRGFHRRTKIEEN